MEGKRLPKFIYHRRTTSSRGRSWQTPQFVCPHLVESNTPPSDDEQKQIVSAISALEKCLIQESENGLEELPIDDRRSYHQQVEEHIRQYQKILSPIRRLPTELLQRIFEEGHSKLISVSGGRWKDLPFVVSQVCQRWRESAISIPSFWNQIPMIKTVYRSGSELNRFNRFLQNILLRSQELPLEICLDIDSTTSKGDCIINTVVGQSQRWRIVGIHTDAKKLRDFRAIKGRLPLLESLNLTRLGFEYDHGPSVIIDIFQDAPVLSRVGISMHPLDQILLPWEQLHSISEDVRRSTTIHFPPNTTPALRELDLCTGQDSGSPLFGSATLLPHLVKLSISVTVINQDLQNLILPALEELVVLRHPANVLPEIMALIARSGSPCRLRFLGIRSAFFEEGQLVALLKKTPYLSKLDINVPPMFDLQALVIKEGQRLLVPRLRCLIIGSLGTPGWWELGPIFADLAQSRCETGLDPTAGGADIFLSGSEFFRLEVFRLKFVVAGEGIAAQAYFHGWHAETYQQTFASELNKFAFGIHTEIPDLNPKVHVPFFKRRKAPQLYPTHAQRVDKIITQIEEFEVTDVGQLYASGLYHCLDWVENALPSQIPGDSSYNIRSRTSTILRRWESMFDEDSQNVKWAILRPHRTLSLEYVASGRSPPEVVLDLFQHRAQRRSNYVEVLLDGSTGRVVPQTGLEDEYNLLVQLGRNYAAGRR